MPLSRGQSQMKELVYFPTTKHSSSGANKDDVLTNPSEQHSLCRAYQLAEINTIFPWLIIFTFSFINILIYPLKTKDVLKQRLIITIIILLPILILIFEVCSNLHTTQHHR